MKLINFFISWVSLAVAVKQFTCTFTDCRQQINLLNFYQLLAFTVCRFYCTAIYSFSRLKEICIQGLLCGFAAGCIDLLESKIGIE